MDNAISPTRFEDYAAWYQQVIKAADLAENSVVRGCMVIKPWGYGVWERLQSELDRRIKETGHENAYFPLFIPLSFLEKEAQHVAGFAKECAVVTHHRLEERDGKLVPTGELEEPLIVRPTSETIIGEAYASWVQSYRDLPLLINQWANVVRWEMRPRMFLRTAEFLWQEGHTAHATAIEAQEEVMRMLEVYRDLAENVLAIPVILGEKTERERFPGAMNTFCIEAMMQDRKALQAGTSHYMGQNFAKSSNIQFLNKDGQLEHAYTTSWGVSTRLIGGVIMTHGDDDGLRLPPKIAPQHVTILPVIPKPEMRDMVLAYAERVKAEISSASYENSPVRVKIDARDIRGGEKNWHWIKKGVPLRIEVGPRDIESNSLVLYRRDRSHREKQIIAISELGATVGSILASIQSGYLEEARARLQANIRKEITNFGEFKEFFTPQNLEKPEIHGGFVWGNWCGDSQAEDLLADLKVTIRCLPLGQETTVGKCIITGREAKCQALFAKAY